MSSETQNNSQQPINNPAPINAEVVQPTVEQFLMTLIGAAGPVIEQINQQKASSEEREADKAIKLAHINKEIQLQQLSSDQRLATQRLWFNGSVIVACLAASCFISWFASPLLATFLNIVSFIVGAMFGEHLPNLRKVVTKQKAESSGDGDD